MTTHLFPYVLFALLSFVSSVSAASEEDGRAPVKKINRPLSNASEKHSSSSVRPRPIVSAPTTPWTLEETTDLITYIQQQKLWEPFFQVLSALPNPEDPSSGFIHHSYFSTPSLNLHDPYHLHLYHPVLFQGATFRAGQSVALHLTHTGLIMKAINEGTLLEALKKNDKKNFKEIIDFVETKTNPNSK